MDYNSERQETSRIASREVTKNKESNNTTGHKHDSSEKNVMTWKDVHSKVSEEKHIAEWCDLVTFSVKRKKNLTGFDIKKHLEIWTLGC